MTSNMDIPGYEGYSASAEGQILGKRGRVMKTYRNPKNGYLYVHIGAVHKLVALAFLGPRPKGLDVRHLNGNKLDCRATNLAYGTRRENMLDAREHGTLHNSRKTHCKRGHEFDYVTPATGARQCKTCKQDRKDAR